MRRDTLRPVPVPYAHFCKIMCKTMLIRRKKCESNVSILFVKLFSTTDNYGAQWISMTCRVIQMTSSVWIRASCKINLRYSFSKFCNTDCEALSTPLICFSARKCAKFGENQCWSTFLN